MNRPPMIQTAIPMAPAPSPEASPSLPPMADRTTTSAPQSTEAQKFPQPPVGGQVMRYGTSFNHEDFQERYVVTSTPQETFMDVYDVVMVGRKLVN